MPLTFVKIVQKVLKFGFKYCKNMKKTTLFKLICFLGISVNVTSQTIIPKRSYAIDWLYPVNVSAPKIPKFSKLELGVVLNDSLVTQINAYLKNLAGNKLNPFNPEDLDIYGEFSVQQNEKWSEPTRINAFYFEDYRRNTSNPDIGKWTWTNLNTSDKFRIRFTPSQVGNCQVLVMIRVKNKEIVKLGPYPFSCVNSKSKGFVKVSSNDRYLQLGEESFLPIGQNMPRPVCPIEKDATGKITSDLYGCANCPCAGIEDWCSHVKEYPMLPKPYMVYLEEMENLKAAGGNYFRMINFPFTYDIEFEKLGNYYDRLHCAWELDQMFNKAEELDLKVHFNLFLGYSVSNAPYGVRNWDWYSQSPDDPGYCYQKELGLKEPIEFLTSAEAKKHYKNKLRYMIARWGHSTAIGALEMMSEINNKFANNPIDIYNWHGEMTKYIKEELNHKNHLLVVDYDGAGPNEKNGDLSYSLKTVDILGHNIHRATIDRWGSQDTYLRYSKYRKPMIFSEIGTGDEGFEMCDQNTEWIKDLWMTMFSGSATAGINWNQFHNVELWKNFAKVQAYAKDIDWKNYTELEHIVTKNGMLELLATSDMINENSVGVIQNLSWNYFTNGKGGNCVTKFIPKENLRNFVDVSEMNKKGLMLKRFSRLTEYQIDWYSPLTGEKVSSSNIRSTLFRKVPLRHPTLNKDLPFVLYKLYPKKIGFTSKKNSPLPKKEIPQPNNFPSE